eukprot:XP_001611179.1 hypothetical protein [Babesia bovis T2Bo]
MIDSATSATVNDQSKGSKDVKQDLESQSDEIRNSLLNDNFDDELKELILETYDKPPSANNKVVSSELDWFDDDGPIDSEDEILNLEYCDQKTVDVESIYEKMDPSGLRKYLPKSTNRIERTLGNVYEVNQPIVDDDVVAKQSESTIPLPSHIKEKLANSRAFKDARKLAEDADIKVMAPSDENKFLTEMDDELSTDDCSDEGPSGDVDANSSGGNVHSSTEENDNVFIEDDAIRYFMDLPMLRWTNYDVEAYNTAVKKLSTYHRHYQELPRQLGTASPYDVFSADPCSSVGVNDGSCSMSLSEELEALESVKVDGVDLNFEEYTHSDLLNDIDAYEADGYPPEVSQLVDMDANLSIFTMSEFTPNYSQVNVVDPRVYISIPKSNVEEGEVGLTVMGEPCFVNRVRDQRLGQLINKIPLKDQPHMGTILIPNEFGYLDQNIRYMADEIGVVSRSLMFVPDISDDDLMFSLTLNRLIKLMQTAFNIDRISIIALGSQGRRVIHYVYTAMKETVERTLNDFQITHPKLNPEKYKIVNNFNRYNNIVSRQNTPMFGDIFDAVQYMEHSDSLKAAERERDYNVIKPLCNILQSIVLWDSLEVNFKEVVELGVPILFNMSNRVKVFGDLLRLDNPKFLSKKKRCDSNDSQDLIYMFDFFKGKVPSELSDVIGEHVRMAYKGHKNDADVPDVYQFVTNHTGIDICMNVFREAPGHFYMKKPDASRGELNALGNAILSSADWINNWSF